MRERHVERQFERLCRSRGLRQKKTALQRTQRGGGKNAFVGSVANFAADGVPV
jgi:hypothetical protein